MPSMLLKSEALAVEVDGVVYWVKVETRKVSRPGATPAPIIHYLAYLPPGMARRPIRGKEREAVVAEAVAAVRRQAQAQG